MKHKPLRPQRQARTTDFYIHMVWDMFTQGKRYYSCAGDKLSKLASCSIMKPESSSKLPEDHLRVSKEVI